MKILLTSAGFQNRKIAEKFLELLGKPSKDAGVLFIPTAAIDETAKFYAEKCKTELLACGVIEPNLHLYNFEYKMTEPEALSYDVVYFTGGNTLHLLSRIKENRFDSIIKAMIRQGKTYVGVSAGSMIMTPNISLDHPLDSSTSALGYLQAYLAVHCNQIDERWVTETQSRLPLQLIALHDMQGILVNKDGYTIIE